ncbi:hypothetical protein [Hyalangium rubrum]|uniref:Uncharacterized protein n=1 Tax=Hyalangium rubrum TaxID=3103134 RepID=A0ABU5GYZ6_9BACT|nr:hypothetical protein [Hyalangium sp. s54d21]MDY7226427.1 hypothetical protein [Hyalangium sp. s54d21]
MKPHQAYAHGYEHGLAVISEPADSRNTSTHAHVPRPVARLGLVRAGTYLTEPVTPPRREEPSLAPSLAEYLKRLKELGAVEGTQGAVELNPTLLPVLEALHHVLAGGEVEVRVVRDGQQDLFQELSVRALQGLQETTGFSEHEEVDAAV